MTPGAHTLSVAMLPTMQFRAPQEELDAIRTASKCSRLSVSAWIRTRLYQCAKLEMGDLADLLREAQHGRLRRDESTVPFVTGLSVTQTNALERKRYEGEFDLSRAASSRPLESAPVAPGANPGAGPLPNWRTTRTDLLEAACGLAFCALIAQQSDPRAFLSIETWKAQVYQDAQRDWPNEDDAAWRNDVIGACWSGRVWREGDMEIATNDAGRVFAIRAKGSAS